MRSNSMVLALLVSLSLALAGCGDDGDSDGTETATGTGSETETGTETQTGTQTGEPPSEEPVVKNCDATATAGVVLTQRGLCDFEELGLDPTQYKSGLVEMTWDSLQPGVLDVTLSIESDGCNRGVTGNDCAIKESSGLQAPLSVTLSTSDLEQYGGDGMAAYAGVTGAAADQPFTIYVSLFELDQVPAGYTAL